MRPAKIVAIVIGVLLIIIGLGLLVPGSILLWLNGAAEQGYINTSYRTLDSGGHALVTGDVNIGLGADDWIPGDLEFQIRAESAHDASLFLGIGPSEDVIDYLGGSSYDEVTDIGWFSSGVQYRTRGVGGSAPAPPGQQTFWVAKAEGAGPQTVKWDIQGGNWTAVLMNADGSAPVSARVSLGAHLGFLLPLGIGVTVGGAVLLVVGILLVVLGARNSRKRAEPAQMAPAGQPYGQPPHAHPPYGAPPQYAQYPPAAAQPTGPTPAETPGPSGPGEAPPGSGPPEQ